VSIRPLGFDPEEAVYSPASYLYLVSDARTKMTKVEAIVQPNRFEQIKDAFIGSV